MESKEDEFSDPNKNYSDPKEIILLPSEPKSLTILPSLMNSADINNNNSSGQAVIFQKSKTLINLINPEALKCLFEMNIEKRSQTKAHKFTLILNDSNQNSPLNRNLPQKLIQLAVCTKTESVTSGNGEMDDGLFEMRPIDCDMTHDFKERTIKWMQNLFFFSNTSEAVLRALTNKMKPMVFKKSKKSCSSNSLPSKHIFLIENGKIRKCSFKDRNEGIILQEGDFVGYHNFFVKPIKSFSAYEVLEDSLLWGLSNDDFINTVKELKETSIIRIRPQLDNWELFNNLTSVEKDCLAQYLKPSSFPKGTVLIEEGSRSNGLYFILEGKCSVSNKAELIYFLEKDSWCGENNFTGKRSKVTVKCDSEELKCLMVAQEEMHHIFGSNIFEVISSNIKLSALRKSLLLGRIPDKRLQKLSEDMESFCYHENKTIVSDDFEPEKLMILIDGALITKNKKVNQLAKGVLVGEEYLKNQTLFQKYGKIKVRKDTVIAEIQIHRVKTILGEDLIKLQTIEEKNGKSHPEFGFYKEDKAGKYELILTTPFYVEKLLGNGSFGKVFKCRSTHNEKIYAVKLLSKDKENTDTKAFRNEMALAQRLKNRFIMKTFAAYEDLNHVFIMTEYISGIEMLQLFSNPLPSEQTRFYIGSLLLAVEYLHNKQIIHRDIKPENIIITYKNGYIKLIDFGCAKVSAFSYNKPLESEEKSDQGSPSSGTFLKNSLETYKNNNFFSLRTFTFMGTPYYTAPEIIRGEGHSVYVDLWSIGICMFEMLYNYLPFGEGLEDPYEIYERVVCDKLVFPKSNNPDKLAENLIRILLERIPERRLMHSYDYLKNHPWLDDIDFELLARGKIKAPFVPQREKTERK